MRILNLHESAFVDAMTQIANDELSTGPRMPELIHG